MLRNNTPDISHEIISKVNKFINSTVEGKTSICELCGLKLVCLVSLHFLMLILSIIIDIININ